MSNRVSAITRLNRAVGSVVEPLERRQLLAGDASIIQALPFALEFDSDRGGILDKDGQGTGFTWVQPNSAGTEYQPGLIDLIPETGELRITAPGTATTGSNYNADNTLKNGVQTQFDATATGGFTITVRLKGPLTQFNLNNNQAGVFFGPDQDNWVKLVAIYQNGLTRLQFIDEQLVNGTYTHSYSTTNSYTDIGAFSAINSLDLILSGDPVTGRVNGGFRINDGAYQSVSQSVTLTGAKKTAFFSAAARAGILAAKKADGANPTYVFDVFSIISGQPQSTRPYVTNTNPGNGATEVARDGFIGVDTYLPTPGKVIDATTVSSSTVKLVRTSDGWEVPSVVNVDGAGGSLVLQPTIPLDAFTQYTFNITAGLKDTAGTAFVPYTMSFITGSAVTPTDPNIAFEKVNLPTTAGQEFTSVTLGPDGKLYASTLQGGIYRYNINSDGTLGTGQLIDSVRSAHSGINRLITGVVFDPASTASNLILWVSHGYYAGPTINGEYAPNWTGKIARLSGANLENYQDYVTNMPRSVGDHLNNQPVFGADGKMYLAISSNTAYGAPDNTWGNRREELLSAAIIQIDIAAIAAGISAGNGPQSVRTSDGGTYDPYAPDAPVKILATGVRNAYDLVWHSSGNLFAPTNGSAAGGNSPADPADNDPVALSNIQQTEDDWLFRIVAGRYYGHPNPLRGEYTLNGGNPTSNPDLAQIDAYPVGTQPHATWTPGYSMGKKYSPNGVIEYKSNSFDGRLNGKLLIARYSGGDDIAVVTVDASGNVVGVQAGIAGLTHFVDPLDLVENQSNGHLYIIEHGGKKITLARPITPGANISVDRSALYFNDPYNDGGKSSPTQTIRISNTGSAALALPADGLTISGTHASQFVFVNKPSLPLTIEPGQFIDVQVAMKASTSTGIKTASLVIKSNATSQPTSTISLRGISTTGTGGMNEPSLKRILDLYQIPLNVGDSNAANTVLYSGTEPLATPNDEVAMQRLVKAGAGNVSIEMLGMFGVNSTPALRFGYYDAGSIGGKTELFTVDKDDAQWVNPRAIGTTSFDPGSTSFGLYTIWPNFKNTAKSAHRDAYSEDAFNTWDSNNGHKYRFYPLKDAGGAIVPNAYVVAVEEWDYASANSIGKPNEAYDSNDVVFIIRNVTAAPDAPEIGIENTDAIPFHDRLVFNYVRDKNTQIVVGTDANGNPIYGSDTDKRTAVAIIRNTGSQPLDITNLTTTGAFAVVGGTSMTIAPGASANVTVQFTATGGTVHHGTLNIASNDPDEPTKTVQLSGFWQIRSEDNQEPDLLEIMQVLGYGTKILNPGQVIDNEGKPIPTGDEVISPYWQKAYANLPVTIREIASLHGQGQMPWVRWHLKSASSGGSTPFFQHYVTDGQRMLPRLKDNPNQWAEGTFDVSSTAAFGFAIDQEYTDWNRNTWETDILGPEPGMVDKSTRDPNNPRGHHVRFWPAKDRAGNVIPNTWLMVQDYGPDPQRPYWDPNYDYQDNIFIVTNIKPEAPAAPTGIVASNVPAGISLDWNDNNPRNLAGYNVYRASTAGGALTRLNSSLLSSSTFTDTGPFENDKTYYYRIAAVDTFGSETRSSEFPVTRTGDTVAPSAPAGLVAVGSEVGIALNWTDNTETDLAGYHVYRSSTLGGTYAKITGSLLTSSQFHDAGAPANATSYYRVVAVDAYGNESTPATVEGSRPADLPPASPTALTATASSSGIALDWANNSEADLAGYDIFRATAADGPWTKINGAPVTTSSFTDAQAAAGATSYYYVVAIDAGGNPSSASSTTSATRPGGSTQQPIRIDSAGASPFTDSLSNTWSADVFFTGTSSTKIDATYDVGNTTDDVLYLSRRYGKNFGYAIPIENGSYTLKLHFAESYYQTSGSRKFNVTAEGSMILTNYDIHAAAGYRKATSRVFNVNVTDGQLDIAFASTTSADAIISALEVLPTQAAPVAPTGLVATGSTSGISLDWADNEGNVAGYNVFRASSVGGPWTKINGSLVSASEYLDTQAPSGSESFYYVVAVGTDGQSSSASSTASATRPNSGSGTQNPIRIGSGATSTFTDSSGNVWSADNYATGGSIKSDATYNVGNTVDDALYLSRRFATNFAYAIPVQNGTYTLTLHFAESYYQTSGSRRFNVAAEGATILSNFDIHATGGYRNAVVQSFTVNVSDGQLDLSFASVNGAAAIVSGISVAPSSSTPPPSPTLTTLYKVDSGATTASGDWAADSYFTGGESKNNTFAVGGTTDDALYSSRRFGTSFSYAFAVPAAATYTLKLHFSESYWTSVGARIFDVIAEGTTILDNFDIYKESGAKNALVKTIDVNVADGTLNLDFLTDPAQGHKDMALISAIEVLRIT